MPKIQTYVNSSVYMQIAELVMNRKKEGMDDSSLSSVSSMLLELGLRVYIIQQEKKEGGFNQMEYNKVMLDSTLRVRAMCTEILKMSSLSLNVAEKDFFDLNQLRQSVDNYAIEQVSIFFPGSDSRS